MCQQACHCDVTEEGRLRLIRQRVENTGWFYCDVVRDDIRFLLRKLDEERKAPIFLIPINSQVDNIPITTYEKPKELKQLPDYSSITRDVA